MNYSILKKAGLALSVSIALCAQANELRSIQLDLPAQSADTALIKLAEKSGIQIVFDPVQVEGISTLAVTGYLSLDEALDNMLRGTSLVYQRKSDNLIVVEAPPEGGAEKKLDKNGFELVEEIIVTATRRSTNIQDTAMSISALGSDAIEKRGLVEMEDYLRTVPGVSYQDRGAGSNTVVMRGIAVSPQTEQSSVGVYFGETSVTGLASYSSGNADLKMVDIERVEVLRGPQGTIYGAGSMGGTVRVIPVAPNLEQMEGRVGAEYSNTGEAGGNNTMVQGVINLPLVENKLAVRGVAYRFDNSGYIDNIAASYTGKANNEIAKSYGAVARDRGDIGSSDYNGFRLTALWRPTDRLDITLGHTWQEIEQLGHPKVGLALPGEYSQTDLNTGQQGSDYPGMSNEINLTTLQIDYDVAKGSLVGISSWIESEGQYNQDTSNSFDGVPSDATMLRDYSVFTQEIRYASQFEGPIQILGGLYYEDRQQKIDYRISYTGDPGRESDVIADIAGFFPTPADAPAGFMWDSLSYFWLPTFNVEQKAVFGELSYDLTEQVAITVGGRYFEYDRGETIIAGGSMFIGDLSTEVDSALDSRESGTNFKFNVSWKPNEDALLYAQWAEGFRLGGPQSPLPSICDSDNNGLVETADGGEISVGDIESDTLENYELGYKTSFANDRVSLNAALYRINWEGIPVNVLLACEYSTKVNAGKATSEGIEMESQVRLSDQLRLNLGVSYGEATLVADATSSLGPYAVKGADLPGSSDFTLSSGLEYSFTVAGYEAFAQVDYAYVSEYYNNLGEIGDAAGDYHQIHLKSGLFIGNMTANIFVKNLTNADNLTWIDPFTSEGYRLRPRIIGMNISYAF